MGRAHWGSQLGFVLAATGSAVGLGAIWRFPYIAANNGGGAFLVLFAVLTLLIGFALLQIEMAIGRAGQGSPIAAYRNLGGRMWSGAGYLAVFAAFIVMSFYSVVGGWTLAYGVHTATTQLSVDPEVLGNNFRSLAEHPWRPLFYHLVYLFITVAIVLGGIQRGIERLSKVLMPALFIMMAILIVRGLMLPGASEGVRLLFLPNFDQLGFSGFLDALGLSFWTLSLGMGIMITYGSYLPRGQDLHGAARAVVLLTLLSCFMGALLVLPAAYSLGLGGSAGPGLVFVTMPMVFASMPFGNAFGTIFFALLLVAALTSSISGLEVVVSFLIEEHSMQRRTAVCLAGGGLFVVGVAASLSLGAVPALHFGARSLFDWMDFVSANILLPVCGLLAGLFAAWKVWPQMLGEWHVQPPSTAVYWLQRMTAGVVVPVAICIILWHGL